MKFEGYVSLGSVSLLPDSCGGEEEKQKQEVFRAFAQTPNDMYMYFHTYNRTVNTHFSQTNYDSALFGGIYNPFYDWCLVFNWLLLSRFFGYLP